MKNTKQAENKKRGDKITFRVNVVEDKKIIEYIDKAKNGSGFIKEAIKFYIKALERGLVSSYYLEDTEKEWENVLKTWDNAPAKKEINIINDTEKESNMSEITFGINDFDDERLNNKNPIASINTNNNIFINNADNNRVELNLEDNYEYIDDDDDNGIKTYIDTI